jgi:hypothetical protein
MMKKSHFKSTALFYNFHIYLKHEILAYLCIWSLTNNKQNKSNHTNKQTNKQTSKNKTHKTSVRQSPGATHWAHSATFQLIWWWSFAEQLQSFLFF